MNYSLDQIRAALEDRPVGDGHGDHKIGPKPSDYPDSHLVQPAAVMVPLIARSNAPLSVILTKRSDELRQHAGQVSFPGGRQDDTDESEIATALREAEEEIGLAPQQADILGTLDRYRTGTGFHITPIVAAIAPDFEPIPEPGEVADVFEVPLAFVLNPANHALRSGVWKGVERHYFAMEYDGYSIWGATAAILVGMHTVLAGAGETIGS